MNPSTVLTGPANTDVARAALAIAEQHHRAGSEVLITVPGRVSLEYLRSRGTSMRRSDLRTHSGLMHDLWRSACPGDPPMVDEFDVDLDAFLDRILRRPPRRRWRRRIVILEGERLPVDAYRILRLLEVGTTVIASEGTRPRGPITTIPEIVRSLGLARPRHLSMPVPSTREIIAFANAFYPGGRPGPCDLPEQGGSRPRLVAFANQLEFCRWLAGFEQARPGRRIGVLVERAEQVERMRRLADACGTAVRSFTGGGDAAALRPGSPGIVVLTWASASTLDFDAVVLPELQDVLRPEDLDSWRVLHALAAKARSELVLAYSGRGVPVPVAAIPPALIDDGRGAEWCFGAEERPGSGPAQETSDPADPALADELAGLAGPEPHVRPCPRDSRDVADAVRAARGRLGRDRALRGSGRRDVLSAQEEVGFAALMRAGRVPLREALPVGFRATLDDGDERAAAFDAMVHHNLGLVRSVARTVSAEGLDQDDLAQSGVIGLMHAIERFDAELGTKFSTYATWWIRQAIGRAVDNESQIIRYPVHVRERIRKVSAARAALETSGRPARAPDIARHTGLTVDQVITALRLDRGVVSLDQPAGPDEDTRLGDLVASTAAGDEADPADLVELLDARHTVADVLSRMKDREALVLRLRNGFEDDQPWTLEMIGNRLGVTRERVRQIESKAKASFMRVASRAHPAPPPERSAPAPARPNAIPALRWRAVARGTLLPEVAGLGSRVAQLDALVENLVGRAVAKRASTVRVDADLVSDPLSVMVESDEADGLVPALRNALVARAAAGDGCDPAPEPDDAAAVLALLARFDEITVTSQAPDSTAARLRLTLARRTGHWWLDENDSPTALGRAPATSVVMRGPRSAVLAGSTDIAGDAVRRWRARLGVVHGPLLAGGGLRIELADEKVQYLDPFATQNRATQDLGTEVIFLNGQITEVTMYVLPHPDRLAGSDGYGIGSLAELQANQGIYLKCGDQFIVTGGWMGIPSMERGPESALARVLVDISPADRASWEPASASVRPPAEMVGRLSELARSAARRSAEVFQHRAREFDGGAHA